MHSQEGQNWADLPQDLLLLIVQKLLLGASNKHKAMANVRRACKAWHAACSQYPAALSCRCLPNLSRLCAAFPGPAVLRIHVPEYSASALRPLTSLAQLTSLRLRQKPVGQSTKWENPPEQKDFHYLSSGLKKLSRGNVLPSSSSSGKLRGVTQLLCHLAKGNQDALSALLPELPSLKVASLHFLFSHAF